MFTNQEVTNSIVKLNSRHILSDRFQILLTRLESTCPKRQTLPHFLFTVAVLELCAPQENKKYGDICLLWGNWPSFLLFAGAYCEHSIVSPLLQTVSYGKRALVQIFDCHSIAKCTKYVHF